MGFSDSTYRNDPFYFKMLRIYELCMNEWQSNDIIAISCPNNRLLFLTLLLHSMGIIMTVSSLLLYRLYELSRQLVMLDLASLSANSEKGSH